MARPLCEIGGLAQKHKCPVLYAGDIFDRWNTGPEVINFALANLPPGWAIPGQHDLPNHNYDEIKRSAYWTLVEAGILTNLEPGKEVVLPTSGISGTTVIGWPWGFPPQPFSRKGGSFSVALIHAFAWTSDTGYEGASTENLIGCYQKALVGYDVAVFGDNHKAFLIEGGHGQPWIINCGALMRRKTDEQSYRPSVGLLFESGFVERHFLDTSVDRFMEMTEAEKQIGCLLDMSAFVSGLKSLGAGDALDFRAALNRFLEANSVSKPVARLVLAACEKGEGYAS